MHFLILAFILSINTRSVVWERLIVDDKEKPGFWTPLDSTTCALLEKARQKWEEDGTADFQFQEITVGLVKQKSSSLNGFWQVCFDSDGARMKKPFSSSLRRQFHPGFWLHSTFSDVGSVTQIKLATGQVRLSRNFFMRVIYTCRSSTISSIIPRTPLPHFRESRVSL